MKYSKVFVLSVVGVMLLCSVAGAVESMWYFQIPHDYASNPFKAQKEWVGKEICIESKIVNMSMTNDGAPVIVFGQEDSGSKYDYAVYDFYFENVSEEIMSLEEGDYTQST